jgi:hypothetical protein
MTPEGAARFRTGFRMTVQRLDERSEFRTTGATGCPWRHLAIGLQTFVHFRFFGRSELKKGDARLEIDRPIAQLGCFDAFATPVGKTAFRTSRPLVGPILYGSKGSA